MSHDQLPDEAIAVLEAADRWLIAADSDPNGYPHKQLELLGDLVESVRAWRKARTW